MAETSVAVHEAEASLVADPGKVERIRSTLRLTDRAGIATFGDGAQRSVADFSEKILRNVRNKDIGDTGGILVGVIEKAKGLDTASLSQRGFLSRFFGTAERELERFRGRFEDVASQIDAIALDLDDRKETLRRDIAVLDDLYAETKNAVGELDAHIVAGDGFVKRFREEELPKIRAGAGTAMGDVQDAVDAEQALERLEKRIFYLRQARQVAILQLPQIRIVQNGDETLIESLQATVSLTIPAWKNKMVLLLGLHNQKKALEQLLTITGATSEMIKASARATGEQAVEIEKASQRGIVDIAALEESNRMLVETVRKVVEVQGEGRAKRADAERRMDAMSTELRTALLSAGGENRR